MRYGFVPLVLNAERFHLRTHQYKMCQTRWNALWFCPIGPQCRALSPAHASIQNVSDTLECVMVLSHWSSMQSAFTCARINTKCVRHVGIRYGFVPLVLNGERFHLRTHQWHCVRHVGMRYGFVPLVLNGERFHLRTHQWHCVRHVGMRYGFVPLVLNGEHCHLRTHQYKMCQTRWNALWFCPIGPQWRALPPAHASMTLCQTRWNALWFCPIGPQWRALPPAHASMTMCQTRWNALWSVGAMVTAPAGSCASKSVPTLLNIVTHTMHSQ